MRGENKGHAWGKKPSRSQPGRYREAGNVRHTEVRMVISSEANGT